MHATLIFEFECEYPQIYSGGILKSMSNLQNPPLGLRNDVM